MPSSKRKFGDIGEREAKEFLIRNGYRILGKNYRIKNIGEIDIVSEKGNKIHFIEVKTRDVKYEKDYPTEFSINTKKRRNLKRICQIYMLKHGYLAEKEWQVDAIFVKVNFANNNHIIEYLQNILWEKYY